MYVCMYGDEFTYNIDSLHTYIVVADAVKLLKGKDLMGRKLRVDFANESQRISRKVERYVCTYVCMYILAH